VSIAHVRKIIAASVLASACAAPQSANGSGAAVESSASTLQAAGSRGGRSQLELLRSIAPEVLDRLARDARPNDRGLVGHNKQGWRGAEYQRSALWYLLAAVRRDDRARAEEAWSAVDETFRHQTEDGGFDRRDDSGAPATAKDVCSDAAFFLAQLSPALLVLQGSPLAAEFSPRIEGVLRRVDRAAPLLARGRAALTEREATATNRYFIDAVASGTTGLLLDRRDLVDEGAYFAGLGLSKQAPEGFFEERGRGDSSYNAVSIWMLAVYDLYFPDPAREAAVSRALQWELGRIQPSGEIDATGNSRTGLGQETYFGKPKEINYGEVELALLYSGRAGPPAFRVGALDAARRVYAFGLQGTLQAK
jgi:hypothetical protein